jgi:ketosteroid isomerase-like protein
MTGQPSNADKLRRLFDAFDEGGPRAAAELIEETFDPDVEFNPRPAADAGGRTYRGLDGVAGFFAELHEALDQVRYESRQFYSRGEDLVIVFTDLAGIDKHTSMLIRQELSLLYEFAGGLATRVTAYDSPADALEAAERGHADA